MKFHFQCGTEPRDQQEETGNDCDVISGLKTLRKKIPQSFSYCELINLPGNGTKVHC